MPRGGDSWEKVRGDPATKVRALLPKRHPSPRSSVTLYQTKPTEETRQGGAAQPETGVRKKETSASLESRHNQ